MSTTAYVALGSNLGDRDAHLAFAVRALEETPGVAVTGRSRVYETDPVGPGDQRAYLNAVLRIETGLPARELLAALLAIEERAGRRRDAGGPRWSARPLDLDLLFFGTRILDEPGLVVPHPRIAERGFVLAPLADLAPGWVHPVTSRSVSAMLHALTGAGAGAGSGELPAGVRPWHRPLPVGPANDA